MADIYESENSYLGQKKICIDGNDTAITKWISSYGIKATTGVIGYTGNTGPDFQHNQYLYIISRQGILKSGHPNNETKYSITGKNLIPISVYVSVRLCSPATWLNDRDQFLFPNDGWKYDKDFQSDCLAYTLFHGQNRISSANGINHWIPFTPQQVNAPDNFASSFMSDFIAGKLKPQSADTLFDEEESLIPTEPIKFTPAAQAVMEAGRKLWEYYLHKNDHVLYAEPVNVNASFYDIRAYFQGFENGKMRNKSDDEHYNKLLRDLRNAQKVLAKQIEKKVYLYGFLKGEVTYDEKELLSENMELKKRIQELEHQHQQGGGSLVNYGTVNIYEK